MAKVSRYQRSSLKKQRKVAMKKTKPAKRYSYKNLNTRVGNNPQNLLIHRGIGIPDRFRTKLSWTESIVLTSFGTTITQSYAVGMNNPYDPQTAIGGNQPAYWDQLIALYKNATVIGSKLTATFALPTTSQAGDGPYIVGVLTQSSSSSLPTTDAPTLVAAENCGYDILQQGGEVKRVTVTYSPMKSLGREPTEDSVIVTGTGGPGTIYNALAFASPQGTSTAGSVNVIVTIEYIVDFFNINTVVDT